MSRHFQFGAIVVLALLPQEIQADTEVSMGGLLGAHLFSPTIELGNVDNVSSTSPRNSISFGVRAGYQLIPTLRLESELTITPTVTRSTAEDVTIFAFRSHALIDLLPEKRLHPFVLVGAGLLAISPAQNETLQEDFDVALHIGMGGEYEMAASWSLRVDIRMLLTPSTEGKAPTGNYEFFVGLTRHFMPFKGDDFPDQDGDGVHDSDDRCPDEVEDQDGYLDEDGCPEPDNDGDGILDGSDQCPSDAENINGIDDEDGCPDSEPLL